ncbi:MAG: Fructose-1,6-bisphosphatase/inositol-1-monophosphatase [Turneriella sp.]|nr:Fructose-1,6-bisphosphatase/inositol-1-monophosphatase [Turneriella sp.]
MSLYKEEHDFLLPILYEAGKKVMQYFIERNFRVEHKDPENPVTDADFAANQILCNALNKNFPGDAILSEESQSAAERKRMEERLNKKRVWIIDPIDGTRAFIHGKAEFAISVGLAISGEAVLGFVYNPAKNYLLSGGKTLGLFLNGKKITLPNPAKIYSSPKEAPNTIVSYSEYKAGLLGRIEKWIPNLAENKISSIAYKLALVADGTYDLVVSLRPKNEWDVAGGAALLSATGLLLLDGAFKPYVFNKPDTETNGLVAGAQSACDWYKTISS